ncbi:hypothetical protein KCP74_20345 [Salmonella enterica subsp. enterica]|nr:hypothetical protein KCP74_20345 [Salmonella enterica subsp. enterica]
MPYERRLRSWEDAAESFWLGFAYVIYGALRPGSIQCFGGNAAFRWRRAARSFLGGAEGIAPPTLRRLRESFPGLFFCRRLAHLVRAGDLPLSVSG